MSEVERKRPGIAPPARLPYALLLLSFWFGGDLMDWLGADQLEPSILRFVAGIAPTVVLAILTFWIQGRWLRENGFTQPGARRRLPPELWVGLGVFIVGMSVPRVFDLGREPSAVVVALTLMAVTAIVILAALKDPDRKAEDERRHREGWTGPFE